MTLALWPIGVEPQSATWQMRSSYIEQVSEWTGRSRVAVWGPAARITGDLTFSGLTQDQIHRLRYIVGAISAGRRFTHVYLTEKSQYYFDLNAQDNLVKDSEMLSDWIIPSQIVRTTAGLSYQTALYAPAPMAVFSQTSGTHTMTYGAPTQFPFSPNARLFLSFNGLFYQGATGSIAMRAEWFNASNSLISSSDVSFVAGSGSYPNAVVWYRVRGFATAPTGTASVRLSLVFTVTGPARLVAAAPRASVFPEAGYVDGAGQSGSTLLIRDVALSRLHLLDGSMVTIELGGGEVQTVPLASAALSNGAGQMLLSFLHPLRKSPNNGALVHLARPFAAFRAPADALRWQAEPHEVYSASLQLVEAH